MLAGMILEVRTMVRQAVFGVSVSVSVVVVRQGHVKIQIHYRGVSLAMSLEGEGRTVSLSPVRDRLNGHRGVF
jgi:hypothetical protein